MFVRVVLSLVLVVVSAGCRKSSQPQPGVEPFARDEVMHTQTCGKVTANWYGDPTDRDSLKNQGVLGSTRESIGVTRVEFRFEDGHVARYPTNDSWLEWSYEVFSPDCAYVALLSDRSGPYHVVRVSELDEMLGGRVKPIEIKAPGTTGGILTDSKWVSNDELEFFRHCCGGSQVYRWSVKTQRMTEVFSADSTPSGIRRTATGYEVIK